MSTRVHAPETENHTTPLDTVLDPAHIAPPSVAGVDRMLGADRQAAPSGAAPKTNGLVGPPSLDLGGCFVGQRNDFPANVLINFDDSEMHVRCRLEGDPSIILHSAPSRIRPRKEGYDPHAGLTFFVTPNQEGYVRATLYVDASPTNGGAAHQLRIPISAAAHKRGTPTLEQREAEQRSKERQERDEKTEEQHHKEAEKQVEKEYESKDAYHRGHSDKLDGLESELRGTMEATFRRQRDGIDLAMREIDGFKRKLPSEQVDVAKALAFAALEIGLVAASGGIAKGVEAAVILLGTTYAASHLEPQSIKNQSQHPQALKRREAPEIKPKTLGYVVGQGVKEAIKLGGRAAISSAKGKPTEPKPPTQPTVDNDSSDDVATAFRQQQLDALEPNNEAQAARSAHRARMLVQPLLKTDPDKAFAMLKRTSVGVLSQHEMVLKEHAQATVEQWLRLLTHTSVGRIGAGKTAVVDGDKAAETFSKEDPLTPRDGLLDIRFRAWGPRDPVQVTDAKLFGVKKVVAQRIQKTDPKALRVPIRISSNLSGDDYSVTVVRDEAGGISHQESTAGSATSQNWLGKRAASKDPTDGAKKLMSEILSQPLPQIGTDSDT